MISQSIIYYQLKLQLILCSANILLSSIISLHVIIQDVFFKNQEFKYFSIPNGCAITIFLGILSMPIRAAVAIQTETQRLLFLVNRGIIQCNHEPIRKLMKRFNTQIYQRNIAICNDFFNIDWTLLYSVCMKDINSVVSLIDCGIFQILVTSVAYITITLEIDFKKKQNL